MELHHTALRDGRLSDILKNEMRVSTGLMNRLKTTDRILVGGIPQPFFWMSRTRNTPAKTCP